MKLVTSEQMRQVDHDAIVEKGIPGDALMEHAGKGIAEEIIARLDDQVIDAHFYIFCGKGNNGGDGFVIARYLSSVTKEITIFSLGDRDALSEDARLNYDRAVEKNLKIIFINSTDEFPDIDEDDFIIDAIFGTGFYGAPKGLSAEFISFINEQYATIVSVDMPSGLNADDGSFEGEVIQADYTFTLGLPKFGLYLSPGRELAGEVIIVPIGLPDESIDIIKSNVSLITERKANSLLPYRLPTGHKGTFGKLLVISGSTGLTGATTLSAVSAIRSGCGMVKVACPKGVQPVLAKKLTSVMTYPLSDVRNKGCLALRSLGELRELAGQHDALVIGPGLGLHHETKELVRRFLSKNKLPVIIDADAITALVGNTDILKKSDAPIIITPHEGEFKRLFEKSIPSEIQARIELVKSIAVEFDLVLVMKGSPTIIGLPEGNCFLNPTGNNGMATGGSGDVLSGIIGSFLAQSLDIAEAGLLGVYLHGLVGDISAYELTERAMIAEDMCDYLPAAFHLLD